MPPHAMIVRDDVGFRRLITENFHAADRSTSVRGASGIRSRPHAGAVAVGGATRPAARSRAAR